MNVMSGINRYNAVVCAAAMALSLGSCGKKQVQTEPTALGANITVSDSYAFRVEDDRLKVWDLATNCYDIFCSQPNCKHKTLAQDSESRCTAVAPESGQEIRYAFIYENALYMVCSGDLNETVIYKSDIDGQNRKHFMTAEVTLSSLTDPDLAEGTLAFVGSKYDTDNMADLPETYSLCTIDLDEKTFKNYGDVGVANEAVIGRESLYQYDGYIYFQFSKYTDDNQTSTIEYIDTKNSKRKVILKSDETLNVWQCDGGKITYVQTENGEKSSTVCTLDLNSGDTERLFERGGYVSDVYLSGEKCFYFFSEGDEHGAAVRDLSSGETAECRFAENEWVSVLGHSTNGHLLEIQNGESESFLLCSDDDFGGLDFKNAATAEGVYGDENSTSNDAQTDYEFDDEGFARFDVKQVEKTVDYGNKTKIVYLSNYDTKYTTTDDDPLIYDEAYIENAVNEYLDELGCDFYVDIVNNGEFDFKTGEIYPNVDVYKAMIESGEQVDIVNTGVGLADYGGYTDTFHIFIENGWLEPLNDYLQTAEGKALYAQFDETMWAQTTDSDGVIYGIACEKLPASPLVLSFNDEACAQVGLGKNDVNTLDDMIPYLEKYIWQNKAGLVLDSTNDLLYEMAGFCKYKGVYINAETGKVENIFKNKEALEYLKTVEKLKNSGSVTNREDDNALCSLRPAMPFAYDSTAVVAEGYLQTEEQNVAVGICAESKNKGKAFELLTLLNTDEKLADLLCNGVEGRNYVMKDGEKRLNKNALPYYDTNDSLANALLTSGNALTDLNFAESAEVCREHSHISPFYGLEISDELSAKLEKVAAVYDEFYPLFYGDYGEYGTLDKALAAAEKKLKKVGADEALDELNAAKSAKI